MRRLRLLLTTALTSLMVAAGMVAITQPAAAADERYVAPASGYWDVNGRGWGHGWGMSQWGAQGAAQQGVGYEKILDFYYPGTTMNTVGNTGIRVALSAYTPTSTATFDVPSGQTITVRDASTKATIASGTGRFTITRSGTTFTLEHRESILATPSPKVDSNATRLEVSSGDGVAIFPALTATDGKWYRGFFQLVGTSAGAFDVVNHLSLEEYLRGVVPRESPAGWHPEALKAQAVAARSYALTEHKNANFDTCDTTQCQVYGGRAEVVADGSDFLPKSSEAASTDAAIAATKGKVRWYQGAVAFTQFHATNGGYGRAGSKPYLVAQFDPYTGTATGDTRTRWTDRLNVSTVAQQCPGTGGTLNSIVITRDGNGELGGRITNLRVECSTGTRDITATGTIAFGMYSHWWRPVEPPYGFFLNDEWDAFADTIFQYGRPDDEVYVGDWDGDGIDTIAIRRGAEFFIRNTNAGGDADTVVVYGKPGDVVLVGDWDGDGTDTLAVRRGAQYHIKNSISGGPADLVVVYGRAGDQVLVGDWDGKNGDTLAVRRGAEYFIKNSITPGNADKVVVYGRAGDAVMVGDWDGDGNDTLAVRRGREYHIKNSIAPGAADLVLAYGRPDDDVLVGDWDANGTDTLGVHRRP